MVTDRPWRAVAGDKFDDEGFPIITDADTLKAHPGTETSIWLPGRTYASSVSARVGEDDNVMLTREGHGDVLTFDRGMALSRTAPVFLNSRHVGNIRLLPGGQEAGFFWPTNVRLQERRQFAELVTGLVMLGSAFLI